MKDLSIVLVKAVRKIQNYNLGSTRVEPWLSRALLKKLIYRKNFHVIKESLQLDGNMLCYVKVSEFEGLDHSEGQSCTSYKN